MKTSIAAAITAHQAWAQDLNQALNCQKITSAMQLAGYDDMCEFGKWIYNLSDEIKITPAFRAVKDLHYRFHQEAALVVDLARAGDYDRAKLLSYGQFAETSGLLVKAMEVLQARL